MIPRYQRVLYWALIGAIGLMLLLLLYGCVHQHSRIVAMRDESRIAAPSDLPSEQVSIAAANDADSSVVLDDVTMSLPADPAMRARLILDRMFNDLSGSSSTHPVPAGKAVTDVFLLSLPVVNPSTSNDYEAPQQASPYGHLHPANAQLAVINLTQEFADAHASGIAEEDLTLRAVIATIHANLPDVEEVRFLVNGQTRETLAGHADLTRPYAVVDPLHFIHELSATGNPM